MDMIKFELPVKNITWHTSSHGFLKPLIKFDKVHKAKRGKKELEFDAISLDSYKEISEKMVGVGSTLEVSFDDNLSPVVVAVHNLSKNHNLPETCESCGQRVFQHEDDFICINHLCHAQGRSPIFRLVLASTLKMFEDDAIQAVHKWLTSFPSNKDFSNIDHLYTFLTLFNQEWANVDTPERLSKLDSVLGEDAQYINEVEQSIKKYVSEGLRSTDFWFILGLPDLPTSDVNKFLRHDLYKDGVKKLPAISSKGKTAIDNNRQLIDLILTELIKFKNKP